jgi:hypothetical protein
LAICAILAGNATFGVTFYCNFAEKIRPLVIVSRINAIVPEASLP